MGTLVQPVASPGVPAQQAALNYGTCIISSRDERWRRPGTGRSATCQRFYGKQDPALCKGHGPAHSCPPCSVSGQAGMQAEAVPRGSRGNGLPLFLPAALETRGQRAVNPCPALPLASLRWAGRGVMPRAFAHTCRAWLSKM